MSVKIINILLLQKRKSVKEGCFFSIEINLTQLQKLVSQLIVKKEGIESKAILRLNSSACSRCLQPFEQTSIDGLMKRQYISGIKFVAAASGKDKKVAKPKEYTDDNTSV